MTSEKDKEYCDACMKLGLAEFLSWGRKPNIAILGAEEELLKCPHDVWHDRMDIHNSLSIIQKNSNGSKKIKFVLPLFEETFGTLTEQNFTEPEPGGVYWNEFIERYKNLISETFETLKEHGFVQQEKNKFILLTNDKSLTLWDLYSTLKYRLHHVLC